MKSMRVWGLLFAFLGLTGTLPAQEKKLEVKVSYGLGKELLDLQRLALRPNTIQPIYFYLVNPDEEQRRNVNFKLVRLDADGQPFVLQQANVPVVGAQKTVRLNFAKGVVKPEVKPEAKESGKPAAPPWPQVEGPPFRLQVWVDSDKNPEPMKINVPLILMEPREYVSVGGGMTYDVKTNRLSVRVKANKEFSGPPCPVQLVLAPDLLPGLVLTKKGGVFKQLLTEPDQEIELLALDLRFQDAPPKNGRIHLTIDGYERAFMFRTTFAQGILPLFPEEKRLRIYAPRYSQPAPKFLARLEVDGAPSTPGRVELGIDRVGDGVNFDTRTFKGLRQQMVSLGTSPDGDLLFRTEVDDWKVELDTTDVFGKRFLRGQLVAGYEGKKLVMPLADEQNLREETPLTFLRGAQDLFAPLSFKMNAVFAETILDGTAPEGLRLINVPLSLTQGQAHNVRLRARLKPRSDEQAPLSKVKFYVGKVGEGGKLPEEAVDGKLVDEKNDIWEGEVLIPSDKKDRVEVGVLATTRTGVSAESTEKIVLVTAGGGKATDKAARITGTVREGDRIQAGLVVTLRDNKEKDKGKIKATTKTDAKGVYVFENVSPGSYTVFVARPASRTTGTKKVDVPEGAETLAKMDITLFR